MKILTRTIVYARSIRRRTYTMHRYNIIIIQRIQDLVHMGSPGYVYGIPGRGIQDGTRAGRYEMITCSNKKNAVSALSIWGQFEKSKVKYRLVTIFVKYTFNFCAPYCNVSFLLTQLVGLGCVGVHCSQGKCALIRISDQPLLALTLCSWDFKLRTISALRQNSYDTNIHT